MPVRQNRQEIEPLAERAADCFYYRLRMEKGPSLPTRVAARNLQVDVIQTEVAGPPEEGVTKVGPSALFQGFGSDSYSP